MAVSEIKQYRQKDGTDILKVFTKPTKKFPDGDYFYVDAKDIDVIQSYNWLLDYSSKLICISCKINDYDYKSTLFFHQALAYKYLGYYPNCIDHVNGLELDNTDMNLNVVTNQQNNLNKPTRGYIIDCRCRAFQARIKLYGKVLLPYSYIHSEVEASQLAYLVETEYLRGILKDNYYMYNFLEDRRNDLDILDLERTGVLSHEESIYKHVLRYAKDNAWYYYRYNLAKYFKDNHIPAPKFITDEQGFMRHPVTNKLLCPFYYRR